MKIAFVINGLISKKKSLMHEIESIFQDDEIACFISQSPKHQIRLTEEAIYNGYKTIAAVGGDGTVNEVLNGIISSQQTANQQVDWQAIKRLQLIVIPRGSGNDFSRMLYKNNHLESIYRLYQNNAFEDIDIGQADFFDFDGKPVRRYFINIADIGLGANVVKKKTTYQRWLPGKLNYSYSILSTLLTYTKKEVKIKTNHGAWQGKVMSLVIANGRFFGYGLGIAPNAQVNDGQFSIVRLGEIRIFDYIKKLSQLKACRPINHPEVDYSSANAIEVSSISENPLSIDMDGEYVGVTPLTIRCRHKKIKVLSTGEF